MKGYKGMIVYHNNSYSHHNTMETAYMNKIKEWVELDNRVQRHEETIKPHKEALETSKKEIAPILEERKKVEDSILEYIEKNKFDKLTVNISDGIIKFGKKTTQQTLSLKVIKALLDAYAEQEDPDFDVMKLYEFIADNIKKTTNMYMKRDFK